MLSFHNLLMLLILTASFVWRGLPQQKVTTGQEPKPVVSTSAINGKVFAITKGGDLKPARFARIYLLWFSASEEETPYTVFQKKEKEEKELLVAKRRQQINELLDTKKGKKRPPASNTLWVGDDCEMDLLAVDKALVGTMDWVKAANKNDVWFMAETDENGEFAINNVKEGVYTIVVRGQAGSNDVFWKQDITVRADEPTPLKVTSVELACLNP